MHLQRELDRGIDIKRLIGNVKCSEDNQLYNPALDKCVDVVTHHTGPTLQYFMNPTAAVKPAPFKESAVKPAPPAPRPQLMPEKETYVWKGIGAIVSYLYGFNYYVLTAPASQYLSKGAMDVMLDYVEGIINLAKRSLRQDPGDVRTMRSTILRGYPAMLRLQAQEYTPRRPWGILQTSAFPSQLVAAYGLDEYMTSTSLQSSFLQVLEYLVREALRRAAFEAPVQTDHWKPYWKLWTEWSYRKDARIDEQSMKQAIGSLEIKTMYHCTTPAIKDIPCAFPSRSIKGTP